MSYKDYLPPEENKLVGIYKVSFEIQVGSEDALALSDVAQALTEGFGKGFGEDFVTRKVADLSIEKITKKAVKVLKVGDTVLLKEPIKITANIYSDDGYIFTGVQGYKILSTAFPPFKVVLDAFTIYIGFRIILRLLKALPVLGKTIE